MATSGADFTPITEADRTITTTDLEREIFAKFEVEYNLDKLNQGIASLIESEKKNEAKRETLTQTTAETHLAVLGKTPQLAAASGKMRVKCVSCSNDNPRDFIEFPSEARMVCKRCGAVAKESMLFEGEWLRQYEGETTPSQHGPPPDFRFSGEHNLRTAFDSGAFASAGTKTRAKENAQRQKIVERGSLDEAAAGQRTLIATKDHDKRKAFSQIDEVAEALSLHGAVSNAAKTLYAHYRDDHETVHNRDRWIALSIVLAQRRLRDSELSHQVLAAKKKESQPAADESKKRPREEAISQFICDGCDTGFSNKQSLRFHKLKECPVAIAKRAKLEEQA